MIYDTTNATANVNEKGNRRSRHKEAEVICVRVTTYARMLSHTMRYHMRGEKYKQIEGVISVKSRCP